MAEYKIDVSATLEHATEVKAKRYYSREEEIGFKV
jgi:hypothetical protein